ncbi:RIP metalloprotease RseP [Aneurinibacillus thermoaerophilus]|uniref:RIP metalloprotease RseP n=1 Tax=Aneurinibacillus thermoaerophilus TaxID=143495 RepID=UPI002E22EDD3|nr:RIP metalloprotease RseP [Aneurinibacillus thermoaerophilus]MED0677946.1 RIP metalloprotease RseP [Aneurinibacillus thermoaerophilus]MED0763375.1 RIP metalloprotease RseP [Aneurinibacillus thermoaerophilus]
MVQVLAIVLVFGLLVFIHELGHLLLAKRAGILCREFAIGMGPKLFSFVKGETRYTLRLLPIGGFVRMAGEDPEVIEIHHGQDVGLTFDKDGKVTHIILTNIRNHPEATVVTVKEADLEHQLLIRGIEDGEEVSYPVHPKAVILQHNQETQIAPYDRQFGSKTVGQRATAIFAGPLANFLLAFVLLTGLGLAYGVPVDKPIIGQTIPDQPAAQAGLKQGDKVLSVAGKPMNTWKDIVQIVSASPGKELTFVIEREGEQFSVPVTPVKEGEIGKIGVYSPTSKSPLGAAKYGAVTTYEFSKLIYQMLGKLFTGQVPVQELSGPVGIFNYTYKAAENGLVVLVQWAAALSVNLGIMNLLPLPALDGGRLVFIGIEALRGRPIDPQKEGMVHFLGFAFLMVLILVVTWNDIQRFF